MSSQSAGVARPLDQDPSRDGQGMPVTGAPPGPALSSKLRNFATLLRPLNRLRPYGRHSNDCDCEGRFYRCAGCGRMARWCNGAHDELPEHCDACWWKAQAAS